MTHREARSGAAIAGTILSAIPLIDMLLNPGSPNLVHLMIGIIGAAFILVGLAGRLS
jgi:hypothetical protein